jgi:FkbM family methyltransferase
MIMNVLKTFFYKLYRKFPASIDYVGKLNDELRGNLQEREERLRGNLQEHEERLRGNLQEHEERLHNSFTVLAQNLENLNKKINKLATQFTNQLDWLQVYLPFERVWYVNIGWEKSFNLDKFCADMEAMGNFGDRFFNLVKGLDSESIETVVRVINRVRLAHISTASQLNVYSTDEQCAIRDMWEHFDKCILKLSDNLYSWNGLLLPYRSFNPTVLYYRNGIPGLKTLEFIKQCDIINAGGFIGDSILTLSPLTKKHVYSFEAVEENYNLMLQTIKLNNLTNVIPENIAITDYIGTLNIFIDKSTPDNHSATMKHGDGDIPVITVACSTIDEYVEANNIKVGLITTDIEGAEQALLRGAVDTITKFLPTMIISIYHTADDFFGIKPMLESMNLGYKFRIYRPPMLNVLNDTLLIAECEHN